MSILCFHVLQSPLNKFYLLCAIIEFKMGRIYTWDKEIDTIRLVGENHHC